MTKEKPKGPALDFHRHTNFDGMTSTATHKRDVENLSKVQNARPLKPPVRRQK